MVPISQRSSVSAFLVTLTALAACGNRSALDDAVRVTAAPCTPSVTATRAPQFHRACPASCAPNFTNARDTCTADSDCAGRRCSAGQCTFDACLAPSDCSGGRICTCGTENASGANACSPAQCQLDSDCGSGGFCSPSPDAFCGASRTWRCHTVNDTCLDDSDCDAGLCRYAPEIGAWSCFGPSHCGG